VNKDYQCADITSSNVQVIPCIAEISYAYIMSRPVNLNTRYTRQTVVS